MAQYVVAVIVTLIFGGITFGILIETWTKPEPQRGIGSFFGFWVVAGLSVHFGIEGWTAIL